MESIFILRLSKVFNQAAAKQQSNFGSTVASKILISLFRPRVEPVDHGAARERGELAAAVTHARTDGRHAEDDVQIGAHAADEEGLDVVLGGGDAGLLARLAARADDLLPLVVGKEVGHLVRVRVRVRVRARVRVRVRARVRVRVRKRLGTSPLLRMLLMSSTKASMTICVSAKRKTTGVLSQPVWK